MGVKNYGISFGLSVPALNLVSSCLWLAMLWVAIKEKKFSLWLAVLGGGMNLGERICFGYVNDYWKIPLIPLYNNVNDWLIFVGFGWYIFEKWKQVK